MTSKADSFKICPFFLQGKAGKIFSVIYQPVMSDCKKAVLMLPPFAEEMNRSRRAMSLLAQQLATEGVAALILDLYGTGDSEGDFSDGCWSIWLDDANRALDWLIEQGFQTISVLGVRLGAILAAELASSAVVKLGNVVFWQPVISGQVVMTQFLRVFVTTSLHQSHRSEINTDTLRNQLLSGDSIEVGGYILSPILYQDIHKKTLDLDLKSTLPVTWLEISPNQSNKLSPVSQRLINEWQNVGHIDIKIIVVDGGPFWVVSEETDYAESIRKIVSVITGNDLHD